jgi:CheY-like chemotaxis protein
MASILLVGGDEALLEGLAQMLAHAGHVPHAAHSVPDAIEVAASARLQRLVLADLDLPLERHRLLALVQRVDERARATGRRVDERPDHRAR